MTHPQKQAPGPSFLFEIFIVLFLVWIGMIVVAIYGDGWMASLLTAHAAGLRSTECRVSPSFPPEVLRWCEQISLSAAETDLPPDLIAALIWQESGGKSDAYSHSGAVGLMQVMPRDGLATAFECRDGPCFDDRPTIAELRDPDFNIYFGTRLLRQMINANGGDVRRGLKAYGPMDMGYRYADIVLALYHRYKLPIPQPLAEEPHASP